MQVAYEVAISRTVYSVVLTSVVALPIMYTSAKRTLDLCACLLFALPWLLVCGLIALAILCERTGPVFFKQTRVGKQGALFTILKFRTLRNVAHDPANPLPATTGLGRFLRRWGLDELPQLMNVLKGDMSLVGPRPTIPEQVQRYTDYEMQRLAVRPGITGWAQIQGRNSIDWPARIKLDIEYIQRASILLDLRILLTTPWTLFFNAGTYGVEGKNDAFQTASY